MKALISTIEPRESGFRVADISSEEFETTTDFFWVDYEGTIEKDSLWFDPVSQSIKQIPVLTVVTSTAQKTTFTPLQFIDRFTDAEQLAIVTATMQVPAVKLWYDKLLAAQEVILTDPRISAGVDALVASGLVSSSRAQEILPAEFRSSGVLVL